MPKFDTASLQSVYSAAPTATAVLLLVGVVIKRHLLRLICILVVLKHARDLQKQILHASLGDSRCLDELGLVLVRPRERALRRNLPLALQVGFVPNENEILALDRILRETEPVLELVERLLARDVKHEDEALCVPQKVLHQVSECVLSRCVPDSDCYVLSVDENIIDTAAKEQEMSQEVSNADISTDS